MEKKREKKLRLDQLGWFEFGVFAKTVSALGSNIMLGH
jgi:hypothetical protein